MRHWNRPRAIARGGARVTGIDLAERSIELARQNFAHADVADGADLRVADGEALPFHDATFDVVYAHGVLQYTADPERMVGRMSSGLEAERCCGDHGVQPALLAARALQVDEGGPRARRRPCAPPLLDRRVSSAARAVSGRADYARAVSGDFAAARGWKGALYNGLFVGAFNLLPRRMVRPLGWHLMAFCRK